MQEREQRTRSSDARFVLVVNAFAGEPDVTQEKGKGFGSGALKVKGKIFAMISSNGGFVVKLPKQRVADLVGAGQGEPFATGGGRVMKEWVTVTAPPASWIALAREAYDFVKGQTT